jgi:tetratricopeptide (TPR) repeat protein
VASLLLAGLLLLGAPALAQPADSLLLRGKTLLDRGVTQGDAEALRQARALFERAAGGGAPALGHYYVGLADYEIVNAAGDDRAAQEQYLSDATEHLQKALEHRADWAEAYALLSAVYGRRAAGGMRAGMRYGPPSSEAMQRAREIAPDNPRVLLLDAVSLYNKPSAYGGDKAAAVERLKAAIDRFETTTPSDALAPDWGHAQAYVWLGRAHLDAGRPDAARTAFSQALDVRPGYTWVTDVLMPQVSANGTSN